MTVPAIGAAGRLDGPADQQGIRRHNLALVLQYVGEHKSASRAGIAAATGLNKTTVSSLVTDLMDRGLLLENGVSRSGGVGRPAVTVGLDGQSFVALGLEVNVDYLAFTAVDLLGRVRDEGFVQRNNRERDAEETLTSLSLLVRQTLERLQQENLTAIGAMLGLPGLVDISRGEIFVAPNLGWRHVAAAQYLRDRLPGINFDVGVDNEANLGAFAEHWEGAATDLTDFIHVSGDVGVGAGLVIGGELHRGASGFGGEFGHMTLNPDGPRCACGGRGCVQAYTGLEALLALSQHDSLSVRAARTTAAVGPAGTLAAAATAGDRNVLTALETVGTYLGTALASSVNLLAPSAIVLGGCFALLYDWLREPVERELEQRVLSVRWAPVKVLRSQLQRGAAVRGAAAMTLSAIFADPTRVPTR